MADSDKLKPYTFHGVELTTKGDNATGQCPFCKAPNKFGVQVATGQYRCNKCLDTGNIYTFLTKLYSVSRTYNQLPSAYELLAENRNLPPEHLDECGLRLSPITGEWLFPNYNKDDKLVNLSKIVNASDGLQPVTEKCKLRLLSTPGCKPAPFGIDGLLRHPSPQRVIVCEGLWDYMAMYHALLTHRNSKGKDGKPTITPTSDPTLSLYTTTAVIGVPGSGLFYPEWLEYLEGRDADLLYDNDHPKRYPPDHDLAGELMLQKGEPVRPGWDGMQKVIKTINGTKHRPRSLRILNWAAAVGTPEDETMYKLGYNPTLPDGYDIRDLLSNGVARGLRLLSTLMLPIDLSPLEKGGAKRSSNRSPNSSSNNQPPTLPPLPRETFEHLCEDYHGSLYFTQPVQDTLATMLAVAMSTTLADVDQVWLRVIGPPGSGKSTLAEAISAAREWVAPKSIVTGFHSGFVDYDKVTGERLEDSNLLLELNYKTVVMKDADTLINSPGRDRILSELRDIFDGTSRANYRNKVQSNHEDLQITFILCGTDAMRLLNKTFLGERFLDVEIIENVDTAPYLQRASAFTYNALSQSFNAHDHSPSSSPNPATPSSNGSSPTPNANGSDLTNSAGITRSHIRQATHGYIKYLKENLRSFTPPSISNSTLATIEMLARYISYLRARVPETHDLTYRPRVELPTRLTNQLVKLSFSLGLVLNRHEVDDDVMRIVRKVVHDTSLGFQQELLGSVATNPHSIRQMCHQLRLPETNIRRILENMQAFGILQRCAIPNNSGQRGRDKHLWELSPNMRKLWDTLYPTQPPTFKPTTTKRKR